jgi:hypothetical protein
MEMEKAIGVPLSGFYIPRKSRLPAATMGRTGRSRPLAATSKRVTKGVPILARLA